MACFFFAHYCTLKKHFVFLKSGGPKDPVKSNLGPIYAREGGDIYMRAHLCLWIVLLRAFSF